MISGISWEISPDQDPSNFINRLTSEESDRLVYLYLCFIGPVNFEKEDLSPIDNNLERKRIISISYSQNHQRVRTFSSVVGIIKAPIDIDVKILVPIEILFAKTSAIKQLDIICSHGSKRISEFTSLIGELVNELSMGDLPPFLASDNTIISNRAKQRFDKLTYLNR
jgi:hypothetical protein